MITGVLNMMEQNQAEQMTPRRRNRSPLDESERTVRRRLSTTNVFQDTPSTPPPIRQNAFDIMTSRARGMGSAQSPMPFDNLCSKMVHIFLKECAAKKIDPQCEKPFGPLKQRKTTQRGKIVYKTAMNFLMNDEEKLLFDRYRIPDASDTRYLNWLTQITDLAVTVKDRMINDLVSKYNSIGSVTTKKTTRSYRDATVGAISNLIEAVKHNRKL